MGYSSRGCKESDIAGRLTLSFTFLRPVLGLQNRSESTDHSPKLPHAHVYNLYWCDAFVITDERLLVHYY